MRVLFLSDGIPPFVMGGMQKHTLNSVKYLVKYGIDVHLVHCVLHNDDIPSDKEVVNSIFGFKDNPEGFTHQCIKFPPPGKIPGHYVRASKQNARDIYNLVQNQLNSFDFVYIQGFCGWELLENKGKYPHLKMGVHFHGLEMFQQQINAKEKLKSKLLSKPVKRNIALADYSFSLGGKLNEILSNLGVPEEGIIDIPGGIDATWINNSEIKKLNNGLLRVLFVGRYERRKAVEEIHEALTSFKGNANIEFEFVGPIPESVQVKQENVKYLGLIKSVDKMKEIYRRTDLLLCPSYSEGMPNVILEAMSQSCSVLATNVGANALLVNEKTGYLIESNTPESIVSQLNNIINNTAELQLKQEESRKLVNESFSWEVIAKSTIEFLKQFERANTK